MFLSVFIYWSVHVYVIICTYNFEGFCAEYNTVGALVQHHIGLKCSDMKPPCPQHYNSTDAYICKMTEQTTWLNNFFSKYLIYQVIVRLYEGKSSYWRMGGT